jgi:outer membrane protein assembly factor BamB
VYARFGAQSMQPSADKDSSANDTWIVCFAVEQGEKGSEIKYLWQLRGRLLDSEAPAFFEGAPLVRSGRLYVARTRFDGRRSITSIDCFESDSIDRPNDPPSLRWSTDVWNCEAFSNVDGERHQHQLLTDAGPNIVYCSHSGCVVAVDAQSGKRIWAVRYESSPHPLLDGATPPDLSPAIYSSGRIYAAPTDSNRIYCFDALTGAKRWESNPVRVGHLLTADRNQLVVTTGGHPQGIRVYDTQTGNPIWTRPDEGDLMSFGRGMVTTNWIIWPTRLGLRVLRRIDGEPLDGGIHSDVLGNLAFASGCLVAATPTEIVGFVPERYRLPQIELDAKANPDDSFAKLRLVDALIEDGNLLAADTALKEIEERSHAVETQQGQSLSIAGTHRRHRLLMAECVHRFRQSRIADAITLAKTATAGKYMPENRLLAALFLRQINSSLLDDLLESPELRSVWRTRPDGTPETVADCLWRTVSDTSRKARESLAATNMDERSVMRYAETRTGRERCLKIAQQLEHAGNFDSALAHYHAALRSAWNVTDDSSALDDRHNATSGIIRLYERQNYAEAAVSLRRAYSVTKEKPQVPQTEATSPNLVALTWTEAWRVPLSQYAERPLRRFGHELSSQRPTSQLRLYFSSESSLICRSIEDGREIWHKKLEFLGEQVAEWADSVLVAGPGGLSRVRQKDGHVLWSFLAHDSMPQPDQFESYRLNVNQRRDPLHGFILAGPRVFALHNHKLLALDAETGHVLWQRTAPGAPLSPVRFECNFLATEEAVVARTTSDSVLLLDARNGSIRVRKDSARQSWYAAPVALDTHSAIVASDSDRVTCLNLVSGEASWERKLSGRFSLAGTMPQLRQVGGDLLVIIERNYGYEMERWSSANGKPSGDPVLLGSEFPNLALAEIKDRFAVFAYSSRVDAYDLTTSQRTWSTPLPPSTAWHCRAAGSNLLLTPYATTRPATVPQIEGLRTEHKFALPTIGSYHASFNLLYHVLRNRRWQVLQVNPLTGKVHNAFEVSSNGSHGQLLCGDRHAAVYVDGSLIGLKTK